ncbi:hypothetical protein [Xanthovirga aplysinae]|uniref:hypothetical protein n=1 Tax=Xanthovirga aplysinae TaxID=2529853 RepID=UPI0012BC7FE3|nr:hypothetical protein [Xanthovirga aplysinae]MTI30013.1 hypothetical protein [Xanthovirga aplysinae]
MSDVARELGKSTNNISLRTLMSYATTRGFHSSYSSRSNLTAKPMKVGEFRRYEHFLLPPIDPIDDPIDPIEDPRDPREIEDIELRQLE